MAGDKGKAYAAQVLDAAFFGEPLPWKDAGAFVLSLHTADPQADNGDLVAEVAYIGYAPILIARDSTQWERTGETVRNRTEMKFPTCDEADANQHNVTHWAIRPDRDTTIVWSAAFANPLRIVAMIRPAVDVGAIEITES